MEEDFQLFLDEVTKLARKTQKATAEVELSVQTLKQNASDIEGYSKNSNELITDIENMIVDFQQRIKNLSSNTKQIQQDSLDIVYSIFIVLIKLDHLLFRANGYKAVLLDDNILSFSDHHNCKAW